MNGLEKILGAISSEAEAEAALKLSAAKEAARAVEWMNSVCEHLAQ